MWLTFHETCDIMMLKWGEIMALEKIKILRIKENMTQWELAEKLGVSASAVGMYEQGRREPDAKTLMKIARIFSVSVDELLGEKENIEVTAFCDEFFKKLSKRELGLEGEALTKEELLQIEGAMRVGLEISTHKISEDRKRGR